MSEYDLFDRLVTPLWFGLGVGMLAAWALFVVAAAPLWMPVYLWRRWQRRDLTRCLPTTDVYTVKLPL